MPANLTPQFVKARNRFRQAKTTEAKLAALEEMLATIPKHKGTDHMQADIKRRIAKLRDGQSKTKKGRGSGYDHIPKDGGGQVVLLGHPNAGKSSLVQALTNAKPDVADYPFSTLVPIPGMMPFEDIQIQLIDLPPLSEEYTEPWVYSLIRSADIALVVVEAGQPSDVEERIEEIQLLVEERHIQLVREACESEEERIRRIPARVVLTKVDGVHQAGEWLKDLPFPCVPVSAESGDGLDALRRMLFDALRIIRIYTKLPGKKPDLTEPYTLPALSTALDGVRTVHREFAERLKYVRIWGSGRFDGQQVPSDHVLEDGDIIEIHVH